MSATKAKAWLRLTTHSHGVIMKQGRVWWWLDNGFGLWPMPKWMVFSTTETGERVARGARCWAVQLTPDGAMRVRSWDEFCQSVSERSLAALALTDVTTPLHPQKTLYDIVDTTGKTVRLEHCKRALIDGAQDVYVQAHWLAALRALGRRAAGNDHSVALAQVAGKGVAMFKPVEQPVVLMVNETARAMVMPYRVANGKPKRVKE